MSELRKANTDYPYFLTFTVVGWVDVFSRTRYADLFLESLTFCTQHKKLEVYAYVIMSNHIHLVARQTEARMGDILRDLKSYTAKQIFRSIENDLGESRKDWLLRFFAYQARINKQNSQYMFWQRTNHPTELSYPDIFWQKVEYTHLNPVAAGYVQNPEDWNYSSASLTNRVPLAEF